MTTVQFNSDGWLPRLGHQAWVFEGTAEEQAASESDLSERAFFVDYFLENPNTRLVQDSGVALGKETEREMALNTPRGRADLGILFFPNKEGRLGGMRARIVCTNRGDAIRWTYDGVTHLLSIFCLQYGRAVSVNSIAVFDSARSPSCKWLSVPIDGPPGPFHLPDSVSLSTDLKALLSLHREGLNTCSPYYAFLCFYKILEMLIGRSSRFREADRIIAEHNLSLHRPRRMITHDVLAQGLALNHAATYEGKSYQAYFEILRSNERVQVAHAIPDNHDLLLLDLDSYENYGEFSTLRNLTEVVARDLLLDEFRLWQELIKRGAVTTP